MLTPRNSRIGALKEVGAYVHIETFPKEKGKFSFHGFCLSKTRVAILYKTDTNPGVATFLGITEDFNWSPQVEQGDPKFYEKLNKAIAELAIPFISEGRLINDFFKDKFPHEKLDMSSL